MNIVLSSAKFFPNGRADVMMMGTGETLNRCSDIDHVAIENHPWWNDHTEGIFLCSVEGKTSSDTISLSHSVRKPMWAVSDFMTTVILFYLHK